MATPPHVDLFRDMRLSSTAATLLAAGLASVAGLLPAGTQAAEPLDSHPIVLAAGDIASCAYSSDEATAELVEKTPGLVLTLGDNAYSEGSPGQFSECYDQSWGRFRDRTRPAPGNHDYATPGAGGYFGYFGEAAGNPALGYYSFRLGTWRLVALNSSCADAGGCGASSAQAAWLRTELAASKSLCTLVYWHHPRFSSGAHGDNPRLEPLWEILYEHGAELILNGHDHDYERFAPQTPGGERDTAYGIREFVVGTGGAPLRPFGPAARNSELRSSGSHGVLALTLSRGGYAWDFLAADGELTDRGLGRCHRRPARANSRTTALLLKKARALLRAKPS